MKKRVRVTIEKLIEINLPDELLTPAFLDEFGSFMFKVESPDDLFKHAAWHVASFDEVYIEGLGPVLYSSRGNDEQIYYTLIDESAEKEIQS